MSLSRRVRKLSQQIPVAAVRLGFKVAGVMTPLAVWGANRIFYRPGRRHTLEGLGVAGVEEIHIDVRGRRATAYVAGAGRPVLMVHGWQTSAAHLTRFAQALVERGFRVVTFDMPGHARSQGEETDITEVTEIGLQLSARFGPFAAVVGHSYGGLCLANLLREGISAERLVLVACPATYQLLVDRLCTTLALSGSVKERFIEGVHKRYLPYSLERDFNAVTNVGKCRLPTLIVHDREDRLVPVTDADLLKNAHADVQVMITSGLGHTYIMKSSDVIDACVAFLLSEAGKGVGGNASNATGSGERQWQKDAM